MPGEIELKENKRMGSENHKFCSKDLCSERCSLSEDFLISTCTTRSTFSDPLDQRFQHFHRQLIDFTAAGASRAMQLRRMFTQAVLQPSLQVGSILSRVGFEPKIDLTGKMPKLWQTSRKLSDIEGSVDPQFAIDSIMQNARRKSRMLVPRTTRVWIFRNFWFRPIFFLPPM